MEELKIKISIDEESYLEVERKVKHIAELFRDIHWLYGLFSLGIVIGFTACLVAVSLP
jgi:hypothetical protein